MGGFDDEELQKCYNSNDPEMSLKDYGLATPAHTGVPWITINGVVQKENYEEDVLIKAVRSAGSSVGPISLAIVTRHTEKKALRRSLITGLTDWSAHKNMTC